MYPIIYVTAHIHVKSGDIAHNMKIELRAVSDCMPHKQNYLEM